MAVLDAFERKGLFGFTRLLALSVVGLLILGLIGGLIAWGSTLFASDKKRVEPEKVIAALKPLPTSVDGDASGGRAPAEPPPPSGVLPGLKIPFRLQPYFSRVGSREFMRGKLSDMPLSDQQEYVQNMEEVVAAANSAGISEPEAIETYLLMKDREISDAAARKVVRQQTRIYVLQAVGSAFGLIGLFSLVLVLLAIERNTRVRGEAVR